MSEFKLDVKEEGDVVVITTEGYLNNVGGEKIAEACYEKIESGKNQFLLNLERSSVVNSICLLYTSPSPRDMRRSRMPSSA